MSITAISPYIAALQLRPPWRSQPNMEGLMPELVCLSDLSRQHHTLFDMEQDLMAIRNLADGIILIASDGEDDDPATNSIREIAFVIRSRVDALFAARLKGLR